MSTITSAPLVRSPNRPCPHAWMGLFACAVVFALAACGGGSSINATKCAAACVPPTGTPCEGQDPSACQSQCEAFIAGLTVNCAQCIVENSGFHGIHCSGGCTKCCPTAFGSGSGRTSSCASGSTCSTADEKCSGFAIARSTDSACAAACAN